jgi:signal transduction histidine kinase
VQDEGKGISAETLDNPKTSGGLGIGITGMRERVRQLGGNLQIISDEAGTLVRAEFPVTELEESGRDTGISQPASPSG